ncbi:MAG: hypothetical protein ACI7YS_12480 [Flavobacterium sp.]
MKKIYTKNDYKKRNTKRAKDRLKQRLLSKEKAKVKRKRLMGVSVVQQREQRENNKYESLKAPTNFSFVENTMEILAYFENIQRHINRRKPILINLKEITNLTNDAIVLLLVLVIFKKKDLSTRFLIRKKKKKFTINLTKHCVYLFSK